MSKRASKRGQASKENDVDSDLVDFQPVKKWFKQGHVTSGVCDPMGKPTIWHENGILNYDGTLC